MKTTHTPGPIEAFEQKFPQYVYHSHKGVKSVQWREAAINLAAANADLLAALEGLMTHFVGDRNATNLYGEGGIAADVARAALARAKGEA